MNRLLLKFILIFLLFLNAIFLTGCKETSMPKPRGYFRIDLPEKIYRQYKSPCGFSFFHPSYSEIEIDTFPGAEDCWIDLNFPTLNGTLHLSYKKVAGNLRNLTEDSRTLAMKHAVRAIEIEELPFRTKNNIHGLRYNIRGSVASSIQLYLTDSVRNFMRMSLYFNVPPNPDSLEPVLRFIEQDIEIMLDSFRWEDAIQSVS